MLETWVRSLGQEDPLEKEMATHSSILGWEFPWLEKPGRATVHWGARVGHDLVTKPSPFSGRLSGSPSTPESESSFYLMDPPAAPGGLFQVT